MFVRFPSISAQPEYAKHVQLCAEWLAEHLRAIGLREVRLVPTGGLPVVYAASARDWQRPTVLIYGHYDVQPADPLEEWHSPPFKPVVRGEYLYGRGASDDKGQLFAHVKALEAYLRTAAELPVNVICLFEGEEEIGSPNLPDFLLQHKQALAADVAVVSDMAMRGRDRPAITYALRGALSLELEVRGQELDLHSGVFGGVVHNPLQALCELIARLHHANGRIAVPGFYDQVRSWPVRERRFMAANGPADREILRNASSSLPWGESGFTLYERATIRPSLTVTGITGGYQGAGPKSVIPAHAKAKLNIRLVPHQEPGHIERLLRRYVSAITPPTVRSRVSAHPAAWPALIDRRHPAMRAAAAAYRHGYGVQPAFLRSGGTIPVVNLLQENLGIPTVIMGFGLPDDHIHGPNERLHLPTFLKAINTSISFLSEIGQQPALKQRRTNLQRLELAHDC